MSITVENPDALPELEGRTFGSDLQLHISQELVNSFIAVSGDTQWIHRDTGRARAELPDGKTVAPGGLIVALLPRFVQSIFKVEHFDKSVAAGFRQVRFRRPLSTGSIIYATAHVLSVKRTPRFVRMELECKVFQNDTDGVIAEAIVTDLYYRHTARHRHR